MKEERKGVVMVDEGGSCENYLRLVDRKFHRSGKELQKEQSPNLSLEVRGRRERQ